MCQRLGVSCLIADPCSTYPPVLYWGSENSRENTNLGKSFQRVAQAKEHHDRAHTDGPATEAQSQGLFCESALVGHLA